MDRRNFLRSILGVAVATALPSEVWPFRKIFLPPEPKIIASALGVPDLETISAIELEAFAKEIPVLYEGSRRIYQMFAKNFKVGSGSSWRPQVVLD